MRMIRWRKEMWNSCLRKLGMFLSLKLVIERGWRWWNKIFYLIWGMLSSKYSTNIGTEVPQKLTTSECLLRWARTPFWKITVCISSFKSTPNFENSTSMGTFPWTLGAEILKNSTDLWNWDWIYLLHEFLLAMAIFPSLGQPSIRKPP